MLWNNLTAANAGNVCVELYADVSLNMKNLEALLCGFLVLLGLLLDIKVGLCASYHEARRFIVIVDRNLVYIQTHIWFAFSIELNIICLYWAGSWSTCQIYVSQTTRRYQSPRSSSVNRYSVRKMQTYSSKLSKINIKHTCKEFLMNFVPVFSPGSDGWGFDFELNKRFHLWRSMAVMVTIIFPQPGYAYVTVMEGMLVTCLFELLSDVMAIYRLL